MKKVLIGFFFLIIIFTGCEEDSITIGYTPLGLPIQLSISSSGEFNLIFNGEVETPLGTFSLSYDGYRNISHCTYVEIIDTKNNEKIVFVLDKYLDNIEINTKYKTSIYITNYYTYSVIKIYANEFEYYLNSKKNNVVQKHEFPRSPYPNFWLCKKVKVDWSIDSFWDFIADILYIILYLILAIIDLTIMFILFLLRLIGWIILIIFDFLASLF